ncbi:hypothetical protein ATCC90586_003239 [Pythium insidiosum]|nr:hypothetical protein ATCC90586_003239 [Pythium insidiosum]
MDTAATSPEAEILAPPNDGVTSLRFCPTGNRAQLLVSSWDAVLRVYEGVRLRAKVELDAPILACAYGGSESEAFAGGLDCAVKQVDLHTKQVRVLGNHRAAVRHVDYSRDYGLAVSGGWDGAVKVWDVRNGNGACINQAALEGKIFGMDLRSHLLVVSTSTRQNVVYDLRNFSRPLQQKESPLKFQTRCVRVFPDMRGYAVGSIEGRVALEYFNDDYSRDDQRSYAFKCHREKMENNETLIFPVNAIAFHPSYGTFATGGCDGAVNMWDGNNKKRITHLRKYPTSISALDFNHDGSVLAIASSYTYEEGEKDHPNDAIFLYSVQPSQVRPKVKAPSGDSAQP